MSRLKFKCPCCKQQVQTSSGNIELETGVEVQAVCPKCGKKYTFTADLPDQKDGLWEGHLTPPK
jgi:endogenous inhibitor of DNA gyrase (YacG/DUF329 family)